jgi:hypothetical protein
MRTELRAVSVWNVRNGKRKMSVNTGAIVLAGVGEWFTENG